MKVIIIKDCKDGKVNDIIDVSPGYGSNYLIKNKLAVPYNEKNLAILHKNLAKLEAEEQEQRVQAMLLKGELEKVNLEFTLKEHNNVIHHSITGKKIQKALEEKGFKLPKHSIEEHLHIASLGFTEVKIKLHKNIVAKIQVHVTKED
ncbi:50S ribosomal protein L9 [Candidatus Mycoplasma pogonae]